MDLFPLWNSLRVAAISTVIVFFAGVFAAYYIARLPRLVKGVLDVVLTLPLVLPPTVCGWFLLLLFGRNHPVGRWCCPPPSSVICYCGCWGQSGSSARGCCVISA